MFKSKKSTLDQMQITKCRRYCLCCAETSTCKSRKKMSTPETKRRRTSPDHDVTYIVVSSDTFGHTTLPSFEVLDHVDSGLSQDTSLTEVTENPDADTSETVLVNHSDVSETPSVSPDDEPTFQVVSDGSQKGKHKLFQSDGYAYTITRRRASVTYWRCSVRSKTLTCPATISQRGDIFIPGIHSHNHPAVKAKVPVSDSKQVECRVCDELFSIQGEKVPRLLHCGHTVCHQCLTRLPLHGRALLCPFDRQATEVGDSGIWGLKKNFALIELLEKLQHVNVKPESKWDEEDLSKERDLSVRCDENEDHVAVLYCTVCMTHLCLECAEASHSTRTLAKHPRVPLSEKPRENPKCVYHPMHLVEFACLEAECANSPLMCYICKDYGRHVKHKHTLCETEAENVRVSILNAVQRIKSFADEVSDSARKLCAVSQQLEGPFQVVQDENGYQMTIQMPGISEEARMKVRQYFQELQETLKHQEVAAMAVVDTHVRERLAMLKQQQEDMAVLLSQISAVCHQCEKTLKEDDAKVLLAKNEVKTLLESIAKQQQQISLLPDQLQVDANIPLTFTKDNRVHIGPKMEMRVVTLGLDGAGKTSILYQLKQREFVQTIPTIGFNVETVEYKNLQFTIWDVGGQHKLRPLWKHYYLNTQAIIYVIDSSNRDRMAEAHNELAKLLQEKELKEASLLVFANKQDLQTSLSIEDLTEQLSLFKLCCSRSWHLQGCDAMNGSGLHDGLEWLSHQLVAARV